MNFDTTINRQHYSSLFNPCDIMQIDSAVSDEATMINLLICPFLSPFLRLVDQVAWKANFRSAS
jgi:hypothetical protein